jgi:sugar O-acyltransferase (sialic acid O-acetyltransferase NeuD family)
MKSVIIAGSGGHAKVVIDIIHEMNLISKDIKIIGITSNSLSISDSFFGYPILGNDDIFKSYADDKNFFVAMGLGGYRDNILREKVFQYVKSMGVTFMNVIHPLAIISRTAILGEGIVIFPGVIINTEVIIGDNTIIATGSTIDHETIIDSNVLVSAGVTVGAYSKIGKYCVLALGSKVISGIDIEQNVLVAAGAVVVSNVMKNKIVFGIPAKEK